jgi:heme oxygenase
MSSQLAAKLREGTKKPHSTAENTGFVLCLIKGVVEPISLRKFISYLYFVYSALEQNLEKHRNHPVVGPMYFPELNRTANLQQDLAYYYGENWRDQITPSENCDTFVARIHAVSVTHPELLVAHAYTRYLGDLSGGQAFRKIFRNALNLPEDQGTRFYEFDEITDIQGFKGRYREALDSLVVSDEMADKIVAEANESFYLSRSLFKGLEVDLIKVIGQAEFDRIASQTHPGSTETVGPRS